ncbi:MAG: glutathione S-transferase family protein [Lysobacterales bacterium]|jgi:glutathione S-transferase
MYRLHGFFTQNTMKTLYVLEELGVEYEFRYVDLAKGEHHAEAFRAATPVGRVPVLEHDGEFLFESGAICRYVAGEEHSPLFPADKLQRARVDQWMTFFTCHPGRALTAVFFEKLVKPRAGYGAPSQVVIEEQLRWARQHLTLVDAWLNEHDWLANDALSIADPFALAYVEQARAIEFALDDFPHVVDWLERLEARDATVRARALVEPHAKAILG